ncbi:hypothetical protein RG47T_5141 [Mucilaginibacter polytrichastri]|uniref:Uncharacterized protein n=1 Tax=Mucilaginibacter polytrichastri TaxID=1302689 RepID=A0A1Q6A6R0_9SPHI|nr:hypothetical protein RG47T_5141 [Mucilaginibacter polytrichastri]
MMEVGVNKLIIIKMAMILFLCFRFFLGNRIPIKRKIAFIFLLV